VTDLPETAPPEGESSEATPRVLMLSSHASIGGIAQIMLTVAERLGSRGWRVDAAFPPLDDGGAFETWARARGVALTSSDAIAGLCRAKRWRDIPSLRALVRGFAPDVVNYHTGHTISLKTVLALRAAGVPLVISVHDPYPSSLIVRRQSLLAGRLASRLVANSSATRDMLEAIGIPARKIELIPCGVVVPEMLPAREEARAELGVAPNAFVIAAAGRLNRRKGMHELIEAVAALPPDDGRPLQLLIGGDGSQREALTTQAELALGRRARLTGQLPSLDTLYAAADVFALPSRFEGFGLVYVEAALHGVPSVGYRAGGVPDAILDGETGLLVQPGDLDALTAALQRLRRDDGLRQRLGAAARERARGELSADRMADRYARVFSEASRPR
jgi:glycosyltransferase involved in cell wall biosynthesis